MKKIQLYFFIVITLFISACNQVDEKQKKAAEEALTALKKLQAAVQVGMNKVQYSNLLIEAQSAVNQAHQVLPDGELKKALNDTVETYTDANNVWNGKVVMQNGQNVAIKYGAGKLSEITESEIKHDELRDPIIQMIWRIAGEHLKKAITLSEKR